MVTFNLRNGFDAVKAVGNGVVSFFNHCASSLSDIDERNYEWIENNIKARAQGCDDRSIDSYLNLIKQRRYDISKELLETYHAKYKAQRPYFYNQSHASQALWSLAYANDVNPTQRANSVINFMCDKSNWKKASCKLLWQCYMERPFQLHSEGADIKHEERNNQQRLIA